MKKPSSAYFPLLIFQFNVVGYYFFLKKQLINLYNGTSIRVYFTKIKS